MKGKKSVNFMRERWRFPRVKQRGEGTTHPGQRATPWNCSWNLSRRREGEGRSETGRGREREAVTVKNFPQTMKDSKPQVKTA